MHDNKDFVYCPPEAVLEILNFKIFAAMGETLLDVVMIAICACVWQLVTINVTQGSDISNVYNIM